MGRSAWATWGHQCAKTVTIDGEADQLAIQRDDMTAPVFRSFCMRACFWHCSKASYSWRGRVQCSWTGRTLGNPAPTADPEIQEVSIDAVARSWTLGFYSNSWSRVHSGLDHSQ